MPVADPAASFGPTNHPLRLLRPGYLSRRCGVPLRDLEFVALDFETTGLQARTDRVVEVAARRFRVDGTVVDEYATRVGPGRRRVGESRFYHGLTDDDLKEAPGFGEVWPELRRLLSGAVVIAHNLRFEDDFLHRELDRLQVDLAERPPGVCTMVASWTHLRLFNYKQKNLFRTVVGAWPLDAHTALGDVRNLSAIFAALHRRLPDLRYVGPPPVEFETDDARGPMYARPAVEAAIRWNSLPLSTVDHPVTDAAAAALRAGCLNLLDTYRRRDRLTLLVELMAGLGVGARQFVRLFGTTMAAVLAEDPTSLDYMCLDLLDDLMQTLESAEFADILIDAILTGQSCKGMPAPVLYGERWRVPKEHPERDYLDEVLTGLGAQVLLTVRPNLHARVVRQTVHRDTVLDLHPYLAELRRRSVEESAAYLRDWAEQRRGRYRTTTEIPMGTSSGGEEWDRVMVFEARDPELAPDWRWAAKGFRGDPQSWADLDRRPWVADDQDAISSPDYHLDSADAETPHAAERVPSGVHRVEAPERVLLLRRLAVALAAVQSRAGATAFPLISPELGRDDSTEHAVLPKERLAVAISTAEPSRVEAQEVEPDHGHGDDRGSASSPRQQSAPSPGFKRFLLSLILLGFTCFGWPFDGISKWAGVVVSVVLFIWAVVA
ncbi:DNA polymerase III, epsilon subunit [Micromonospora viridifaciens]|uniref:DNA polymerase III, epsilon subunit n=1 Tax=Micromonospora viridifaciens TaxID=1881 RepID=A0A1C4Y605_MICVI|nr:3'-5' exonuclease [Micromonospora viridifaciens]SCF16158.1 DNA polymerase III, epsilon subunit [Micromonospora viridifaciens]